MPEQDGEKSRPKSKVAAALIPPLAALGSLAPATAEATPPPDPAHQLTVDAQPNSPTEFNLPDGTRLATPASPSNETKTANDPPATDADNPLLNEHGELPELEPDFVPPDIAQLMATEAVYLSNNGCSGFLIRNNEGVAIGVVTAEHCFLRGVDAPRYNGTDGHRYIVKPNAIEAQTGPDLNHLTSVGKIGEFIVQADADTTHDLALGVFVGHTAEEVRSHYRKLTAEQVDQLRLNDEMYLSGWPVDQDLNHGALKRQNFALRILGTDTVTTTEGKTLKILWAVVPESKDGARCSFGDSGGEGFVTTWVVGTDGKPHLVANSIGPLAAFYEFVQNANSNISQAEDSLIREQFEAKYGVSFDNKFSAVCGFAIEVPPSIGKAVKVVASTDEIPGYQETYSEEAITARALAYLNDPQQERWAIDGLISYESIPGSAGGRIKGRGGTGDGGEGGIGPGEYPAYDGAYVYRDKPSGKTMLGLFVAGDAGNLQLIDLGQQASYLHIYDRADRPATIRKLTGAIHQLGDRFQDDSGLTFGDQLLNPVVGLSHTLSLIRGREPVALSTG